MNPGSYYYYYIVIIVILLPLLLNNSIVINIFIIHQTPCPGPGKRPRQGIGGTRGEPGLGAQFLMEVHLGFQPKA